MSVIALSIAAAVFYPLFSLNHDASWYLVATDMFLDGSRLYTDILEIYPPLAFYLTVPPVAVARFMGVDPATTYFLYCVSIGFASSLWTLKILQKADLAVSERHGLFFAVIVTQFIFPIAEYGQREHLMLLFAMPFFMSQILRRSLPKLGLPHQIALGLAASLGLLLKPYFLVIPAAMGLMRLSQDRSLKIFVDPAFLALAGSTILYLLLIALVRPSYLDIVIPMATEVYASYGMEARNVLLRTEMAAMILIAIVVWRCGLISSSSIQMLAAASIAAAVAYLLQFKGWNYQVLPLSAFLMITAAWIFISNTQTVRKGAVHVIYLGLAVIMTLVVQLVRGPYESVTGASFEQFVVAENSSILVLSTNVSASFPFVNEVSGRWASHYSAQWLIPGAYDRLMLNKCSSGRADCANSEEILDFARNSIIEDIEQFQPDIIFVDERERKAYFRSRDFDYFEFLSADARFRELRPCYERIGETMRFGVFSNICAH